MGFLAIYCNMDCTSESTIGFLAICSHTESTMGFLAI